LQMWKLNFWGKAFPNTHMFIDVGLWSSFL
jgi:hypothetical protein